MLLWEMEKELEQEALSSSSRTTSTDDLTHHLQRDSPDHSSINVEFLNVLRYTTKNYQVCIELRLVFILFPIFVKDVGISL